MNIVHIHVDAQPVMAALDRLLAISLTEELRRHVEAMVADLSVFDVQQEGADVRLVPSAELMRLVEQHEARA